MKTIITFLVGVAVISVILLNTAPESKIKVDNSSVDNSSDVVYAINPFLFALDSIKYNHNPKMYFYSEANNNPIFTIKSNNYTDWSNSTIIINQSHIKELRQENGTMIILLGK